MPVYCASPASVFFTALAGLGLVIAYAEIHYRIPFIPSRYFHKQPEIIADIARRFETGKRFAVLLIVKDGHRFPVLISKISLEITGPLNRRFSREIKIDENIKSPFWERILELDAPECMQGWCAVSVVIHYKIGNKRYTCLNDNYQHLPKQPFKTYLAIEPLPLGKNFVTGDLHTHSNYTSDQLEFGASPTSMAILAKKMGHGFVGITDHSYDLDDQPDNYLESDPELRKWQNFHTEVQRLNSRDKKFIVLPGEEVSCGNSRGENVHFLIFNNAEFLPGAGDSGEKWLSHKPDLSIAGVMARTTASAACFASHPESRPPFFQYRLLNRGKWHATDYQHPGLHGLQVWNGEPGLPQKALKVWKNMLLSGHRLFIIAGTDAHGNFNRFRQITKPFWAVADIADKQVFGMQRSLVFLPAKRNADTLTQALRAGAVAVTSGPFLAISAADENRQPVPMGGRISTAKGLLSITARSTREFGPVKKLLLFRGDMLKKTEEICWQKDKFEDANEIVEKIEVTAKNKIRCYYRAQLLGSDQGKVKMQALTNPIWHIPQTANDEA